ncbi:hypothetical protein [Novosphingobium mangrovi (ex Hu et al. 2023)]|uniref:Major tropism determinant N-terminal domain-containing protein n=1 Tax=Novosphingobium mangrovi (ex Hu et al. 2023) TaxID=2930094 RepID=A0ABT0AC52_9SPHN|nr:hypothetical protein [Novosphingobium mangrovi (ex Hu et al. 2023)]MCJ1960778.1 hypothetical protein [Novosphingobium mangrovi (ex Hu et al. 2023)]
MKTHITITEGPLAIVEERDDRTLVYAGENTAEARRQNEIAKGMVDGAAQDVVDARDDALVQVADEGNAKIALAQAWAESSIAPNGTGTRSARSWADQAAISSSTAEAFASPTYADTASGLAATSDGESFAVINDGIVTIYLNASGSPVEQRNLATTAYLASISGATAIGARDGRTAQERFDRQIVKSIASDVSADNAGWLQAAIDDPDRDEIWLPPGPITIASSRWALAMTSSSTTSSSKARFQRPLVISTV